MNKKKVAGTALAASGITALAVVGYYVVTTAILIYKMTRGEEK